MCLAIPGKVIKIDGDQATLDYGEEQRVVGAQFTPDLEIGEYVLVQAKMIVQRVPKEQAVKFLESL
jgi:hydrogenase expression/formation protein HypC